MDSLKIVSEKRMQEIMNRWDTGREILSQPEVWRNWIRPLESHVPEIQRWIKERRPDEIWLSGAGTSAFIGQAIYAHLDRFGGCRTRTISSTDLVAAPYEFFRDGMRPLVVSFGRSGDSSESLGVLNLLDRFAPEADRLNITCNARSVLANRTGPGPGQSRVIVLPEATHDKGFAMTSSYSTMLFTALACLGRAELDEIAGNIEIAAIAAEAALSRNLGDFGLGAVPERLIFLGAGAMEGAARESALKILELTAGQVATFWDTPLGFRHGPKSAIAGDTKVVLFLSQHPITRCYDADLAQEIRNQFGNERIVTIGGEGSDANVELPLGPQDAWNVPICVIPAQAAGVCWADTLGLNADSPFAVQGNLTRVVSGVKLYTDQGW